MSAMLTIPVADDLRGPIEDGTFKAHDGLELHYKRYSPPASVPAVASIVFVHGFIEYIERYVEVFPLFAARGLEVIAFDQRGFGNTAIKAQGGWSKHYTNTTWPDQFRDVKVVVEEQRRWLDGKFADAKLPLYIVGHSMGGGISIALFTRQVGSEQASEFASLKEHIAGVVGLSPWLALTKVSKRWRCRNWPRSPPTLTSSSLPTLFASHPQASFARWRPHCSAGSPT